MYSTWQVSCKVLDHTTPHCVQHMASILQGLGSHYSSLCTAHGKYLARSWITLFLIVYSTWQVSCKVLDHTSPHCVQHMASILQGLGSHCSSLCTAHGKHLARSWITLLLIVYSTWQVSCKVLYHTTPHVLFIFVHIYITTITHVISHHQHTFHIISMSMTRHNFNTHTTNSTHATLSTLSSHCTINTYTTMYHPLKHHFTPSAHISHSHIYAVYVYILYVYMCYTSHTYAFVYILYVYMLHFTHMQCVYILYVYMCYTSFSTMITLIIKYSYFA